MGLQGRAAIAGYVELKPERKPQGEPLSGLQQWAMLAQLALRDAGIALAIAFPMWLLFAKVLQVSLKLFPLAGF